MKFNFMNDTGRPIHVHPGTAIHGVKASHDIIAAFEVAEFEVPENSKPLIKLWDYEEQGLSIFVGMIPNK